MTEQLRRQMISVVSPVFGCADCIERLVSNVRATFESDDLDWELILVDDRGPDQPWDLICRLAEIDTRVRGVQLTRNHGQHLAIWAGLSEARGDWVAVIDCDLQDDPSVLPILHQRAVADKIDALVVDRGSWTDSWFRRAASSAFYRIIGSLSGLHLENVGNFGLYSRRTVDALLRFREQEVFLPMMLALTGHRRATYRLDRSDRAAGRTGYSLKRLVALAIAITIRFSDRPLKISVILGLAISLMAALMSAFLLIGWLTGKFSVQGWTSTILSVWFLSGLIMATLGIHGFYLGRIFSEAKMRPRIFVESKTF